MAEQLGSSTGNNLFITLPSRGDTNWDELVKLLVFQKISDHDHTGSGNGAKITTAAITDANVTEAKLATNSVTTAKITDANVTTAKLADSSVTTAKIAADAVDGTKIADNSITASHIVDGTIITADVADDAITTAKIVDGAVTSNKLNNNVVLASLHDVSAGSPSTGQVIKWNGSAWAKDVVGATTISSTTAFNAYTPQKGDTIVLNTEANYTFSSDIEGLTIFADTSIVNFTNINVKRCTIISDAQINFKNDGTDFEQVTDTVIKTSGNIAFNASGGTGFSGTLGTDRVDIICQDIEILAPTAATKHVLFKNTRVLCRNLTTNESSVNSSSFHGDLKIEEASHLIVDQIGGYICLNDGRLECSTGKKTGHKLKIYTATGSGGSSALNPVADKTDVQGLSGPFAVNRDTIIAEAGVTTRQLSTTQNITSGSGYTKLDLALGLTVGFGYFDTSIMGFRAPFTGAYKITVDGEVDSVPVAGDHTIQIKKNGTTTLDLITSNFIHNHSGGTTKKVSINITRFYQLDANDYIEILSTDNVAIASETMASFIKT